MCKEFIWKKSYCRQTTNHSNVKEAAKSSQLGLKHLRPHALMRSSLCPMRLSLHCVYIAFCLYLLFFNAFIDLGCGFLVGSKQTDDISSLWVQDVPILIANDQVQLKDPGIRVGNTEEES